MNIEDFLPNHKPAAEPGQTIAGRYRVEKEIARGGMAHILRAEDSLLSTMVVLKMLPPALSRNRHAIEEIKQEARISMALNHPNIVKLHQFESTPEYTFLVMEYVDGPSLSDILDDKGKIPLEETIVYARGACAALDYAHSEGIVHRDIKPANFLVDSGNTVKLTDFGIAQKVRKALSKITQKQVMGTIPYMSPEHLMGRKIDYRSDIYSLGAVVHELLSGVPPFFSGNIEAQIMLRIPEPIIGIPGHVNDTILRALSKSPARRWSSAADFYNALTDKAPAKPPAPEEPVHWPEREMKPLAGKRDFRILSVDDEEDIRMIVQAVLAGQGYEVDTATDGKDALEKIASASYNLLVLDVMMPQMDGIQLLSRLRNEGSDVPIVMLTALSDDKHMLESYHSGADYYMSKPFDKDKLIAAARYLLGDFTAEEKEALEQQL